jgi:hypothetical protein
MINKCLKCDTQISLEHKQGSGLCNKHHEEMTQIFTCKECGGFMRGTCKDCGNTTSEFCSKIM